MENRRIVFNLGELRLSKFTVAFIEPVNYVITSLIYRRQISAELSKSDILIWLG